MLLTESFGSYWDQTPDAAAASSMTLYSAAMTPSQYQYLILESRLSDSPELTNVLNVILYQAADIVESNAYPSWEYI